MDHYKVTDYNEITDYDKITSRDQATENENDNINIKPIKVESNHPIFQSASIMVNSNFDHEKWKSKQPEKAKYEYHKSHTIDRKPVRHINIVSKIH